MRLPRGWMSETAESLCGRRHDAIDAVVAALSAGAGDRNRLSVAGVATGPAAVKTRDAENGGGSNPNHRKPRSLPFHACRQHMALRDGRPDALKRVTVLPTGRSGRGAMATSSRSASAKTTGPGKVTGLVDGFAAEVAKRPAEPAPDSGVAVAYALGWAVGEALTWTKYGVSTHLMKVPELSAGAEPWRLLVNQIFSRCTRLHTHLTDARAGLELGDQLRICAELHLDPPNPAEVNTAVGAKNASVAELHTGILEVLWPVEPSLAKAYLLGYEMEQMCATPTVHQSTDVKASVEDHVTDVHSLLLTLASKLPSNAAHATDNSLRLWWASLSAGGEESPEDLLLQGWRWHEVLAGEVAGKDGLRLSDYVAAADSVTGKLWETARQVAARFAVWLIVALVVALLGIGLIVVDAKGTVGAGIASVIAAFGLTWKGIGELFGRAAAKGGEQLWDAEIDWAIAYRFTLLRNPPADRQLKRRSGAFKGDQPTKEHLRRYKQWKAKWPDVALPDAGQASMANA